MMFSASAQVIIVSPILKEIGAALSVPTEQLGGLVFWYTICLGVVALITGPISDRFGRRRVILLGTTCLSITLFLHGIANDFTSLLQARALSGAAAGMLSGAAVAYVGDYFPYNRRGWANGWVMSGIAVGQILGIPLGKLLAANMGYKWPFLMFACTMAVTAVLVLFFLPQPDVERSESLNFRSALTNYGEILTNRKTLNACIVYLLMFLSLGVYIVYFPFWLETEVGVTDTQIALMFLAGGFTNVIIGPMAGKLSDSVGRKPLILLSCVGLALVMILTTYLVAGITSAIILFIAAMVTFALRFSPLQALMTALVGAHRRGVLMSLAVAVGQVGMGLGSGIAGPVYDKMGFSMNTFLGAGAITMMGLLVWVGLPEPDLTDET